MLSHRGGSNPSFSGLDSSTVGYTLTSHSVRIWEVQRSTFNHQGSVIAIDVTSCTACN